ncbi:MAG: hypothetical protein KF864_03780 [Phycisphaeraceae bacterium]|nr:hypothetical protein [Phycisphaeraceae bacterium]
MGWSDRKHGGAWHDKMAKAYADYDAKKYGAHSVRFNQTLVDADGRRVTNLRPDVQVYNPKEKKWIIVEIADSSTMTKEKIDLRTKEMAGTLGVSESKIKIIYHDRGRGASVHAGRRSRPGTRR